MLLFPSKDACQYLSILIFLCCLFYFFSYTSTYVVLYEEAHNISFCNNIDLFNLSLKKYSSSR